MGLGSHRRQADHGAAVAAAAAGTADLRPAALSADASWCPLPAAAACIHGSSELQVQQRAAAGTQLVGE